MIKLKIKNTQLKMSGMKKKGRKAEGINSKTNRTTKLQGFRLCLYTHK